MSVNDRDLLNTPFGFDSTAAEVVAGIDMSGKRAIVTGGSSGIGVETARALAAAAADVTLAVRNVTAGDQTAADITESTGNAAVHVGPLDLADQASVAGFARSWSGPVDVLINNAGVMALPDLELSPEGWVMQFATNHMGHFTLALALHDALAAAGNARIVSLTSRGHLRSPVIFDDVNFAHRAYDPWLAYGQSKTANVLFAVEATRRWAGDRITANAVHPGAIAETNVATSTLVATSPMLEGVGGRYFEDCNEARVIDFNGSDEPTSGVARYAVDPANAERLWKLSVALLETA